MSLRKNIPATKKESERKVSKPTQKGENILENILEIRPAEK
jgi:predicted transcriptional regulator